MNNQGEKFPAILSGFCQISWPGMILGTTGKELSPGGCRGWAEPWEQSSGTLGPSPASPLGEDGAARMEQGWRNGNTRLGGAQLLIRVGGAGLLLGVGETRLIIEVGGAQVNYQGWRGSINCQHWRSSTNYLAVIVIPARLSPAPSPVSSPGGEGK